MLTPWIISLFIYGLFGNGPRADKLPTPGELAAKTRAMMKPVTPERKTVNKKFATVRKLWEDHKCEIVTTVAVTAVTVGYAVVCTRIVNQANTDRKNENTNTVNS